MEAAPSSTRFLLNILLPFVAALHIFVTTELTAIEACSTIIIAAISALLLRNTLYDAKKPPDLREMVVGKGGHFVNAQSERETTDAVVKILRSDGAGTGFLIEVAESI